MSFADSFVNRISSCRRIYGGVLSSLTVWNRFMTVLDSDQNVPRLTIEFANILLERAWSKNRMFVFWQSAVDSKTTIILDANA